MQYLLFIASYKVSEIDIDTFSKILYNVKRFEYYNDKCSLIDINDIKDIIINRYLEIKRNEMKEKGYSREMIFLNLIRYSTLLGKEVDDNFDNNVISSIKGSDSIERDIQNIKLVKLLRKKINS